MCEVARASPDDSQQQSNLSLQGLSGHGGLSGDPTHVMLPNLVLQVAWISWADAMATGSLAPGRSSAQAVRNLVFSCRVTVPPLSQNT